ncbi:hypothetical protein ABK040_011167 [Willaertia magna]
MSYPWNSYVQSSIIKDEINGCLIMGRDGTIWGVGSASVPFNVSPQEAKDLSVKVNQYVDACKGTGFPAPPSFLLGGVKYIGNKAEPSGEEFIATSKDDANVCTVVAKVLGKCVVVGRSLKGNSGSLNIHMSKLATAYSQDPNFN